MKHLSNIYHWTTIRMVCDVALKQVLNNMIMILESKFLIPCEVRFPDPLHFLLSRPGRNQKCQCIGASSPIAWTLSKEPKVQEWGFGSMGEDSTSCNYRQSTGLHIFITNDFFKHDELHWKYNHYMSSIWGRMSDYNHKYNNIINLA